MRKPSEIKIGEYTLEEILERHLHWINEDCEGWEHMKADLHNVDLSYAYLCNANLRYADLHFVNLCNANLSYADLYNANLHNVDLSNADLCNANLHNVDLSNANLHNADLCFANLYNADLRDAKNIPYIPLACPSDGAFIAWKKVEGYLVKLEIPANAKRSSGTTEKCRASEAKVLGIYTLDGKETDLKNIVNTSIKMLNYTDLKNIVITSTKMLNYIVGETVYPDSFDENRWNECSHGIHFFINKQDAINY